jgi:hypothetical protein
MLSWSPACKSHPSVRGCRIPRSICQEPLKVVLLLISPMNPNCFSLKDHLDPCALWSIIRLFDMEIKRSSSTEKYPEILKISTISISFLLCTKRKFCGCHPLPITTPFVFSTYQKEE